MNYSPLRYPGGKAKFAPVIKDIITHNDFSDHYVEPYAGGAGVALYLLFNGYCKTIHINDLDPAIYHFWQSITKETEKFIRAIETIPVTIDEWYKQQDLLFGQQEISSLERGIATFFLNRTNRSGILKGGVIGGKSQSGQYKLDCRFNKPELIKRIEKIGDWADKIHVYNRDTLEWLPEIDKQLSDKSFIYLDPPYYVKGQGLYRNFYEYEDHMNICKMLSNIKTPWVVSYDNANEIEKMYENFLQEKHHLNYSAAKKIKGTEIIIYSPQIHTT